MDLIWGFEILNEPFASNDTETRLLQQFVEATVNTVIAPAISKEQVIVIQPGPGNDQVVQTENYALNTTNQVIFDFHEYIVFGDSLDLQDINSILPGVRNYASNGFGSKKYPYFVGEWSLATTDCAQYLNGAYGGYDPNYYERQHQGRPSFFCNKVDQNRNGQVVGFDSCSVITASSPHSYGFCKLTQANQQNFNQFKNSMCRLFKEYLTGFALNSNNIGQAFWTFWTGADDRRIQQWDFSWIVDQRIVTNIVNPTC